MSQRMEVRLKRPNPVIEDLLTKWLADAQQRNTKAQYKLRDALLALKSYPIPLSNGRECGILRGFSTMLCERIDAALKAQPASEMMVNNVTFQEEVKIAAKRKSIAAAKTKPAPRRKPTKVKSTSTAFTATTAASQRSVTLAPGTFNIQLLVDTQETSGKSKKRTNNCQTCQYLESLAVPYEVRRLTLGDFLWIAKDATGNELVLPYIVERKRMDDLASSIRDGRFHEQKHRLQEWPNVIYMVEDYGENKQLSLPLPTLQQAMINTQIHSNFQIVHTENHYRSMAFLQHATHVLTDHFKTKQLTSVDTIDKMTQSSNLHEQCMFLPHFQHFYQYSARNAQLTVREVFVQQLVQLHSLSLKKALAIVQVYPTPRLLLDAYDACVSEQEARQLLAQIRYDELQHPVGEKISRSVHDFYRTQFA